MGRYFPTRLPLDGRSERDALVGVLVGWNGDRRKKLRAVEYSDDGCGLPKLTTRRNPNPSILKLFYGSNGVVFEDLVPSTQRMKNSMIFALWSWATTNSNVQVVNVIDFLDTLVTM